MHINKFLLGLHLTLFSVIANAGVVYYSHRSYPTKFNMPGWYNWLLLFIMIPGPYIAVAIHSAIKKRK